MAVLSNDGIRAGASGAGTSSYEIARSLRFNKENECWLSRASGSSITDDDKWTLSFWMKRGALGSYGLFSGSQGALGWAHTGQGSFDLRLVSDCFYINWTEGATGSGSSQWSGENVRFLRDTAAWCHIVLVFDSNQASNGNRMKLYFNNELFDDYVTQDTMTQSWAPQVLVNNANLTLGAFTGDANGPAGFFDGRMADAYLIDGQALTPSSFGATTETTGAWDPIEYTGTYGNQGWHLTFSDNSSLTNLGLDSSGNNNHWTPKNFQHDNGAVSNSTADAKSILASSDDYGQNEVTTGTLYNTDSDSADLLLALPFNTNWNDVHHSIEGSGSAQSVDGTGGSWDAFTTSDTKFYGSSLDLTYRAQDDGNGGMPAWRVSNLGFAEYSSFKGTIEWWQKMDSDTGAYTVCDFGVGGNGQNSNGSNGFRIMWNGNRQLQLLVDPENGAGGTGGTITEQPSGVTLTDWNHFAITGDNNSWKMYCNGTQFTSGTKGPPGDDVNGDAYLFVGPHSACGGSNNCSRSFGGLIQDFRVYKKVKYTSNFTVTGPATNLTKIEQDSTVDSPTNYGEDTGAGGEVRGSYATFNPLQIKHTIETKNALNRFRGTTNQQYNAPKSTIALNKGKYYVEFTAVGSGNNGGGCGIIADGYGGWDDNDNLNYGLMLGPHSAIKQNNGYIYSNEGISYDTSQSYAIGDVTNVAVDFDAGKAWFGKNGTWPSNANPATGATPSFTWTADDKLWWYFTAQSYSDDNPGFGWYINTGAVPWTNTCPSGFKAVCTTNLPELGVKKSSSAFDTVDWTGNSTSGRDITGLNFSPDLLWIKKKSSSNTGHNLFDRIRGGDYALYPQTTGQHYQDDSVNQAFNSDGFKLGNASASNASNNQYIAWAWDAGTTSTSVNTAGDIDPSESWVNSAAGFNILKYTGTSSAGTVGHNLSAVPDFWVVKNYDDNSTNWLAYTQKIDGSLDYFLLESNDQKADSGVAVPTNSVFSISANYSTDTKNFIAYLWTEIPGFSKFGCYEATGVDEGPFIYCGFRPALIWIKATNVAGEGTYIFSESQDEPYNVRDNRMRWNSDEASAAYAGNKHDMLSNGFKIRENYAETNTTTNNSKYLYCAWAEHPFKTGRAH